MGCCSSSEEPISRPRPGGPYVPYKGPYMPGPVKPTGVANRSFYESTHGPDNRTSQFSHRGNRDYYGYKNQQDGKNDNIRAYKEAKQSRASQGTLEQLARRVVNTAESELDARIAWMSRYRHELPPDKIRGHKIEIDDCRKTVTKYRSLGEQHRSGIAGQRIS